MGTFISLLLPSRAAVQNTQALTELTSTSQGSASLSVSLSSPKAKVCSGLWSSYFDSAAVELVENWGEVSGSNWLHFAVPLSVVPSRPLLHRPTAHVNGACTELVLPPWKSAKYHCRNKEIPGKTEQGYLWTDSSRTTSFTANRLGSYASKKKRNVNSCAHLNIPATDKTGLEW